MGRFDLVFSCFGLHLLLSVCLVLSEPLSPEQEAELRQFVSATMTCRQTVGLSLSLVRDDQTIFADGFGLRHVDDQLPMLPSTPINIGSETKSFTSSLCAHAVSRGLITWDEPLRGVLGSDFRLEGLFRTAQVSLRDALAHKIGVPSYWGVSTAGMNVSKEELCMKRLKYFPTIYDFRSRYIYSNYPIVLAAYVQEVVTNRTWDNYLSHVLLSPLNMTRTRTASDLREEDWQETAFSYVINNNTFVQNPEQEQLPFLEEISPAGGLFSTAEDMAEWLKFHIRKGKTGSGQIIIPSHVLAETHGSMFTSGREWPRIQKPAFPVENTELTTGMGWYQGTYRGYEKIYHTGSYSSYNCRMTILPDMAVGVWACVNSPGDDRGSAAVETVNMYSLDLLLDETPWLNTTTTCSYPEPWYEESSVMKQEKLKGLHSPSERPSRLNTTYTNTDYIGDYHHEAFGTFYISENTTDTGLIYEFGMLLSGELNYSGTPDVFYMTLNQPLTYRMTFYPEFPDGFPVYFQRDNATGDVISVEVPYFEFELPPIFNKQ